MIHNDSKKHRSKANGHSTFSHFIKHNNPMKHWLLYAIIGLGVAVACHNQNEQVENNPDFLLDQVKTTTLQDIRLGDGVPLGIDLAVRWHIVDAKKFQANYGSPQRYDSLILLPRQYEIVSHISNAFEDVDLVFTTDRERFISTIKEQLAEQLSEELVDVKEVIVSQLTFPSQYTEAKEKIGMQEQKLALIENEKLLALENAKAQEQKAKADGQVRMAQAKMEGEVSEINAQTEKLRRLTTLAKAETDAQVLKLRAAAEAERQKLMAGAEAERQRQLASADLDKQQKLKEQEINKQKELDALSVQKEKDLASLCVDNPQYASFLISKELASKVQIAVLPGDDGGILNSMLQQQLVSTTK